MIALLFKVFVLGYYQVKCGHCLVRRHKNNNNDCWWPKVSSAGFSYFLLLLFVSLCLFSVVSLPSPFLATGPRFGMTKIKIWLIVVFLLTPSRCGMFLIFFTALLLFFASDRLSFPWSIITGGAGRDGAEQNGNGPTWVATATLDGRQAGFTGTFSFIFLSFLLSSCKYSLFFSGYLLFYGAEQ